MNTDPLPDAEPISGLWAIPLDGIVPLSPASAPADAPHLLPAAPDETVLALDWTFQAIPSEGFHPRLARRAA